jgi:Fe-S-cluster-containing dehydrogenase component/DMSO reductase anchor subunit
MPVELPLLDQPVRHGFALRVTGRIQDAPALMPGRAPLPGEQFRFHFDMAKCIGCKCCVVACNEQNGNPAELNWRRVGEIEGGVYPYAQRWNLSMACNHCLEPSCMIGCPVEAYTKDSATGIVDHNPDACIGCQYCVWNCSYGVPQYNPERGVVGKCDMCHGRLSQGRAPACVNACPEGAIAIEIVDMEAWRRNLVGADAPGMPSARDSFSTTRITLPERMVDGVERVDLERTRPQDPHWSLIALLILSQLAVGMVAAGATPLATLLIAAAAMAVAPLHLGRPIHAWRAMKNWRLSWLSREVLALMIFAAAVPLSPWLALAAGLACVTCSARIYMVPARPAWNLWFTLSDFYLTCAVLGPRLVIAANPAGGRWLVAAAFTATLLQCLNSSARVVFLSRSRVHELRASAALIPGAVFGARLLFALLALLPMHPAAPFVFALASETLGRYLFFTAVAPKSMASTYLEPAA